MADNRAFGYIYGSPENGHRFFGIKTEKQAGQVVVAMRDLFQVVFELKKKEIDEAKEQLSKDRREVRIETKLITIYVKRSFHQNYDKGMGKELKQCIQNSCLQYGPKSYFT